ncbi:hypothetical protein EMPG_09758 [Blastomyces silverae]|uniref:Uncharacterized protein n=1 Tax=Blastomyces silverae TaxID=2060906 RepID=A0A0H1BII8_9EURO|nr:hypothetical protein EMPG_09758 [Blastomyces silverae]
MSTPLTPASSSPGEPSEPVQNQRGPGWKDGPVVSETDILLDASTEHKNDSSDGVGGSKESPSPGYPLQRYWRRSLLLVIVPPGITAYFCLIEWFLISKNAKSNQYGHRNALWVYYSWFILGVFGLGISKYGLAGVEATMLQDRHWQVKDAMVLLVHSGQSWSGFSGWMECLQMSIRQRRSVVQRLWYLLSFISLMVTIALPISGLSMELFDGFVQTDNPARVIGYTMENFEIRGPSQVYQRGRPLLQASAPPTLPGAGVAYTPQYLDRSKFSYLKTLPNTFPVKEFAPELFLAPQGQYPVRGSTWGLRLGYNCSVVESASDFTLVGRNSSNMLADSSDIFNLLTYVEIASAWNTTRKHHEDPQNTNTFEFAVWQVRYKDSYEQNAPVNFNNTITSPVSGLGNPLVKIENGTYQINNTFFDARPRSAKTPIEHFDIYGNNITDVIEPAPPVGVRCTFFSEAGTAVLDPDDSSFHSFVPVPAIPINNTAGFYYSANPFGTEVSSLLVSAVPGGEIYDQLFKSTNSPPPESYSNDFRYTYFLQAHQILEAVIRAFSVEALQLMYDGLQSLEGAYEHETLKASKPGKILGPGTIPSLIPLVLFCIWAVGCLVLGVTYGFRRRWAETLDGYSFFRFGADRVEDIRGRPDLVGCNAGLDESEGLKEIPGLIGDSRPGEQVGHIGLVTRRNVADRSKLYM